jgi:Ca2+/Na+ antiporter
MFALARLLFMGFIVLTIIYVFLSLYSRAQRRSKLKAHWTLEGLDDQDTRGDQDDYVQKGLEEYDDSVRRKLILGVYVIPTLLIAVIIYLTNFA